MMMLACSSSSWISRLQVACTSHGLLFYGGMSSLAALQPPARSFESHTLLSWRCAILWVREGKSDGWKRTTLNVVYLAFVI